MPRPKPISAGRKFRGEKLYFSPYIPIPQPRPSILTYQYEDVILGQTYLTLYFLMAQDSTPIHTFILFNSPVNTSNTTANKSQTSNTNGVLTNTGETDFDLTMQLPTILSKGLGIVTFLYRLVETSGTVTGYVRARLRKWDGSSETEIAEARSSVKTDTSTHEFTGRWDITSPVRFNPGDSLRLTIEFWVSTTIASESGNGMNVIADPLSTTLPSKIHIPFRIEPPG